MKVQIQSVRFDADKKLIDYVQRKLDKLDKIFNKVIDAEVILKLNNASPENKTAEVKLNLRGETLFAKAKNNTFEGAMDEAAEGLRRQLKKYKEKLIEHKKSPQN